MADNFWLSWYGECFLSFIHVYLSSSHGVVAIKAHSYNGHLAKLSNLSMSEDVVMFFALDGHTKIRKKFLTEGFRACGHVCILSEKVNHKKQINLPRGFYVLCSMSTGIAPLLRSNIVI